MKEKSTASSQKQIKGEKANIRVHELAKQYNLTSKDLITEIETYVLLADNYDPSLTSSAQDTCLVIIKTDEGIEGYGECDTSPWVAKAFIESHGTNTMDQFVKDILIG